MQVLMNVFAPVLPGQEPSPLLPTPLDFNSSEMHVMSLALNYFNAQNPGSTAGKGAQFKVDQARGAWKRFVEQR